MATQPAPHQDNAPAKPLVLKRKSALGEIWDFLRVRKRFWLAPIIIALVLLGALIVLASSAGTLSPFVYMM